MHTIRKQYLSLVKCKWHELIQQWSRTEEEVEEVEAVEEEEEEEESVSEVVGEDKDQADQ